MNNTTKRAKILFLVLLLLIASTLGQPIYGYVSSGKLKDAIFKIGKDFYISFFIPEKPVFVASTSLPTFTASPKPSPQKTIQTKTNSASQPKECYKYKVTHLDGSTSYLCYSKSDYDLLVDVSYKYSSAKTFYEFHLDGAQDYQDQYDRTGSSIYLDAKASSEQSASREKEKMNAAVAQMQEIEKRGW